MLLPPHYFRIILFLVIPSYGLPVFASSNTEHEEHVCKAEYKNKKYKDYCKDKYKKYKKYNEIIINDPITINELAGDKPVTAVKGTKRNDKIINNSNINLTVSSSSSSSIDLFYESDDKEKHYYKRSSIKKYDYDHDDNEKHEYKKSKNNNLSKLIKLPAIGIGIDGNKGYDRILNNGELTVSLDSTLSNQTGTAISSSVGVSGNNNNDFIINNGLLDVKSKSTIDINDFSLELVNTGNASRNAFSLSYGLMGNHGKDILINNGLLYVTSNGTINILDFDINLIGGGRNINATDLAWSGAVGIDGGDGNDVLQNAGTIKVKAISDIDSVLIQLNGFDVLQGKELRSPLIADAVAVGIQGGKGYDFIQTSGILETKAIADANSWKVELSALNAASGLLSTTAQAWATGLDGGHSSDWLHNAGSLNVFSDSDASTKELDFSLAKISTGGTAILAEAFSKGINGGEGNDVLINSDNMFVTANADTSLFNLDISFINLSFISKLLLPKVDSSNKSYAESYGLIGGYGNNTIYNSGILTVSSVADTDSFDFIWKANAITNPFVLSDFPEAFADKPVADASTSAETFSIGIDSGDGNDNIINEGTLSATATSDVLSWSVRVTTNYTDFTKIKQLSVLPTVYIANLATSSLSNVMGINSDSGNDNVFNSGIVIAKSEAVSTSNRVAATIKPPSNSPPPNPGDPVPFKSPWSLGAGLTDVSAKARSYATGSDTGSGNDFLFNDETGTIKAEAISNANANNINVDLEQASTKLTVNALLAKATTEAYSTTTGINAGKGNDVVKSKGEIQARSLADADSNVVNFDAQILKDTLLNASAKLLKSNTEAHASSTGIELGNGKDVVINDGLLTTDSDALSTAVAVDVTLRMQKKTDAPKFSVTGTGSWVSTDTLANADAQGINGGKDKDLIINTGTVDSNAFADPNSVGVSATATGTKKGASIGLALTQAKSEGEANSSGISGGHDKDNIQNSGFVISKAISDVDATDVSVSLNLTEKGVALTGTAADGSTKGQSNASGISGDEGKDYISNAGTIDVFSDADAETVSVSVAASGASQGVALGLALSRATSEADSTSSGISGGGDSDIIKNSGLVKSHAFTDVVAGSGALAIGGTKKGVTLQGAAADGSTIGKANASGITGDEGYDYILNEDTIDVFADSEASSYGVAVTANAAGTGVALGLALARATSESEAMSSGINGGRDSDVIFNKGKVKSHARSKVVSGSVAVGIGGTSKGLTIEGAAADGSTKGSATAYGIEGGDGYDFIHSNNEIDVNANANSKTVSVAVTANGSGTGVALGIGLARATSAAEANSIGIDGGKDSDKIISDALVKSHAISKSTAIPVSVAAGGTGKGVVLEGAAADGLTKAKSNATAINAGHGNDFIVNKQMIDVFADSETDTDTVSVSANGTGTGLAIGVALARASSEAEANSTGISGGDNNDTISNTNLIKSHAKSDVTSVSVAATLGGAGTGVAIEFAAADAATVGTSNAVGINGDSGKDKIVNEGELDVFADTDAESDSISVSVSGTGTGVGIGVSLARSDTQAIASSSGISLGNTEVIKDNNHKYHHKKYKGKEKYKKKNKDKGSHKHSKSDSEHKHKEKDDDSHKYSKSDSKRKHKEKSGHSKDDKNHYDKYDDKHDDKHHGYNKHEKIEYVENVGNITAKSFADANSLGVSVQLGVTGTGLQAGGALVDASTKAMATANGIEGSHYQDIIINKGNIDAITDADANTVAVSVSLNASLQGASLSAAVTDATAIANSYSTGIAGLSGNDQIFNQGTVNALSTAETDATSVSVALSLSYVPLGVSYADTTAIAHADAFGIDGGEGKDFLKSSGVILADADSKADGISVSVTPVGLAVASADINAESSAIGIKGGAGNDFIYHTETASLSAISHTDATGTVVSATLIGAAGSIFDDASTTSDSLSIGLSGGSGKDFIENKGSIYSEASSNSTGTSVGATLAGAAFSDTSTTSTSNAIGISGGDDKDKVINDGVIDTYALSIGDSTSISASLIGYSDADASSTLTAVTTGIELGLGNDSVLNNGSLTIAARSETEALSVGATLVGVSKAKVNIESNVFARGISGGEGNDVIHNKALITVGPKLDSDGWMSKLTSTGFSFSLAGVTNAESSLTSITRSIGLDGEAGNDHIYNEAGLGISASSYSYSRSTSIGIFGTAESRGKSGSVTEAIGIEAGDGEDKVGNLATINVDTNSYARINTIAFTFGGTSEAGGSLEAANRSVGIAGGNDKDLLFNVGAIDVNATSTMISEGTSTTIFGAGISNPIIGANTTAIGMDAGDGGGLLKNQANIDVTANSNLSLSSSSFTLAGTSAAKGKMAATSNATGISSGDGLDKIWTEQNITVDANASLNSSSGSKAIFGTSDASTTSGATLLAVGIESGAGNDLIQSQSLIDVTASGIVNLNATSYTFAGTSKAGGTLGAFASAVGISGGADDDYIQSDETIRVQASSSLSSIGKSKTTFGNSASNTTVGAVTTTMGIDGGSGNDEIWNRALIDLISGSTVNANGSSSTFGGGSTVSSALVAKDNVTGISGDSGDDKIFNHGNILINSTSNLTSNGGASSGIAGSAASTATVTASSDITGIDSGSGHDTVVNTASITGTARANSSSVTEANAGNFFADGKSRSLAKITSLAYGMNIGSENNIVLNQGSISFTARGKAYAKSVSRGDVINNIFGIDQDAYATSNAHVSKTEVIGLVAGNGINEIQNSGTININVFSEADSYSNADGDAAISGDGTSYAYSYANNAKAYGIKLGHGNNWVMNDGSVNANTKPYVHSYSTSDADGVGEFREPDSRANAYAYANSALAVGISLGNGNNMVVNKGLINVESAPNVDKADAYGGYGGDVLGIDSFARATAQANYATAYGIQVGYGNNQIWNMGTLTVASKPRALTRAHADGVGFDGDASVWSNASAHSALAVGIRTGNGHNNVVNKGVINIYAYPYANAVALAHEATTGEVEDYQRTENTSNAQAIGIWTGNGNDFIVNKNRIYVDASGSSPVEVAIRTGAGNDIVSLEHASYTRGTIDLGANYDTLNIVGTPVVSGTINGGSHTDTAVFYGDGTFANPLINFENTVKKDLGTYTLTELATMKQINVEQGVLKVDGDYTFNLDGTFVPSISSQYHGQFEVTGKVILAGDINVIRGRGHYINGEHYNVLKASNGFINNTTFDNVLIPKAAPLLRFHYKQNDDNLEIHTEVEPFVTVAITDNEKAIANYLDNVLVNAKDDVSAVLGEIQAMGNNEHSKAFADLSPENHTRLSHVAMSSVQKYNNHLHNRMRTLREYKMFTQSAKYPGSLLNVPTKYRRAGEDQPDITQVNQGVWLKGFNQFGNRDSKSQFTALDFNQTGQSLGFDKSINKNWIVGGSYGVIDSEMDIGSNAGSGDVNSDLYSFYSSYFSTNGYVDWTFTRGEHDYLSQRNYSIGFVNTKANSEYSADVTTSSFATGYYLPVNNKKKRYEVFAALQYIHQNEPDFQETGTGGVNIAVSAFEKESIFSQFGIRMASQHSNRLISEIGIGWLHEFDMDDNQVTASFAGVSGSSFTIREEELANDGLLLNAGLTFTNHRGFKTSLEYNTEIRKDYTTQSIMGNITYNF